MVIWSQHRSGCYQWVAGWPLARSYLWPQLPSYPTVTMLTVPVAACGWHEAVQGTYSQFLAQGSQSTRGIVVIWIALEMTDLGQLFKFYQKPEFLSEQFWQRKPGTGAVLISGSCPNKVPLTGWLIQQELILSQFWKGKVHHQSQARRFQGRSCSVLLSELPESLDILGVSWLIAA